MDKPTEKRLAWIAGAIERLEAERDGKPYECDGGCTERGQPPRWQPSLDGSLHAAILYRAKPVAAIRPWNPVEAAGFIGQFVNSSGKTYVSRLEIWSVNGGGVEFYDRGGRATFKELADNYMFDDGSPCGVLESSDA